MKTYEKQFDEAFDNAVKLSIRYTDFPVQIGSAEISIGVKTIFQTIHQRVYFIKSARHEALNFEKFQQMKALLLKEFPLYAGNPGLGALSRALPIEEREILRSMCICIANYFDSFLFL